MRYSEMSHEQRCEILHNPQRYPLQVAFLGKRGLLTVDELAFLLRCGVDFDVADQQISEISEERVSPITGETPVAQTGATTEGQHLEQGVVGTPAGAPEERPGLLLRVAATKVLAWALLMWLARRLASGRRK